MEIIRVAKQRGHQRITLRTFRDVPWNGPFYKSYGFTEEVPTTDFHRLLASAEQSTGLANLGCRVQMVATL